MTSDSDTQDTASLQTFETNSSFSRVLPNLQLVWDSVSSGLAKECWRKYELAILEGFVPKGEQDVHLRFGILIHEAKELYDRMRAGNHSHDVAVLYAVKHAMCSTWDRATQRPWASGDANKNRFTLVRTIVWYFEEYKNDPIKTVMLANNKPAVELSFSYATQFKATTGETFHLAGHLDRLGTLGEATYVCDPKTSKYLLDERWFNQFSPHNQFSGYVLAAKVVYAIPTTGLIVDGIQVAVTFSRFERQLVYRDDAQLEEWLRGFGALAAQAEVNARAGFWPMNEQSCLKYGENRPCVFRGICRHSPAARAAWLASDFVRRTWNPLEVRGDV